MSPLSEQLRARLAARTAARVAGPVGHHAAVALVLRPWGGGELLFIRRAEHPQDPWSGQVAFPGGRREAGDADLVHTARRETLEETGLDLALTADYLGPLDEVRAMARLKPLDLTIAPFVFALRVEPDPLALSSEVRSAHWLPLDALADPGARATLDYSHGGTDLRFPCLRLHELTIWGLTYRMFVNFHSLLGEASPLPGTCPEAVSG